MRDVEYKNITPFFIKNLDYLIKINNFKKYEVAKNIGISPATFTLYLNGGIKRIGADQVDILCKLFNVTENELLNNDLNKLRVLREDSVNYDVNTKFYEDSPLNITLYIHFAKVIDSAFEDEEFKNTFGIDKEQFMNKVSNLNLSLNFIYYLKNVKNLDLNDLFEEKRFEDVFAIGSLFESKWKAKK